MIRCLTPSLVVADALEIQFLKLSYHVVDSSCLSEVSKTGDVETYFLEDSRHALSSHPCLLDALKDAKSVSEGCVKLNYPIRDFTVVPLEMYKGDFLLSVSQLFSLRDSKGVYIMVEQCKTLEECNAIRVSFQKPYSGRPSLLLMDLTSEDIAEVVSKLDEGGMVDLSKLDKGVWNYATTSGYNVVELSANCRDLMMSEQLVAFRRDYGSEDTKTRSGGFKFKK